MITQPPLVIELRPLKSDHHPRPDIACIRIVADGHVLTRLVDDATGGREREYARLSASSLALWWAENWWRLRCEPYPIGYAPSVPWRMAHELTSISGGTRWPPIMFYASGDRLIASPLSGISSVSGPTRYLDVVATSIDGAAYEEATDAFFDEVLKSYSCSEDSQTLHALLTQLKDERSHPELSAWRKLEALLGYDPDEAPDELLQQLGQYETRLGISGVEEASAAVPGIEAAKILQKAIDATEASPVNIDVTSATKSASSGARPTSKVLPWELAEHAAAELRQHLNMPHGPIRARAFSQILEVRWTDLLDAPAAGAQIPYGATLNNGNGHRRCALHSTRGRSSQRRFELARALGDAVWEPDSMFAPLSRARTDRQKFQRAFAQSFLCPFDDLTALLGTTIPSEVDVEKAARHFHVSQAVVRTVLVNKHVLPRQTLDDIVEAA